MERGRGSAKENLVTRPKLSFDETVGKMSTHSRDTGSPKRFEASKNVFPDPLDIVPVLRISSSKLPFAGS